MIQGKVPLAMARSVDDPENSLGTDAIQVQQAIAFVYSNATISAEMALELLPEEQREWCIYVKHQ